jgi:uncharacterized protein YqeY
MSDLRSKIMDDVKAAMKNKEADRLSAIRFLQAAIKNKEIDVRPNTITDEDIMGVIKKMAKQRKDSIEQFENAGRQDLADKEKFELKIIEEYLPSQMSEAQIQAVVEKAIKTLGASSMKDMGAVMKEVQAQTAGAADGKLVSQIVKAKLQ